MKFRHCIFIPMILLLFTAYPAISREESATMDNTAFNSPQRPAAVFDHDDHNETAGLDEDCSTCHHVYENKQLIEDESSEDYSCSDCHALKTSLENPIPLRRAFHNQCKNCHFKSNKGPVLCGECHIRK